MKNLLLLLFIPIVVTMNGCASFQTATADTNSWIEKEMLPSEIRTNGDVFLEGKLADGSTFSVFSDDKIDADQYFYYNAIYRDFGWTNDGEHWNATIYNRVPKFGCIYVNPKKRVAIYFYPKQTFSCFKVRITKP